MHVVNIGEPEPHAWHEAEDAAEAYGAEACALQSSPEAGPGGPGAPGLSHVWPPPWTHFGHALDTVTDNCGESRRCVLGDETGVHAIDQGRGITSEVVVPRTRTGSNWGGDAGSRQNDAVRGLDARMAAAAPDEPVRPGHCRRRLVASRQLHRDRTVDTQPRDGVAACRGARRATARAEPSLDRRGTGSTRFSRPMIGFPVWLSTATGVSFS
jgi:hypothetical protein